jgi:hypothetical protein
MKLVLKKKNGKKKGAELRTCMGTHQKERGIKERFVRELTCLCRTFWLACGTANFTFRFCRFIGKTAHRCSMVNRTMNGASQRAIKSERRLAPH